MEIKGTIYRIDETQSIGIKGFRKREFIVRTEDNPEYPEHRKLELIQDKVELLDFVSEGETVTCHVNLKGRLWTDPQGVEKCFNTDQCWKIEGEESSHQADNKNGQENGYVITSSGDPGEEPDLPF
jgi:single-strand DNA-binding protein